MAKTKSRKKKNYFTTKNTIQPGSHPGTIIDILQKDGFKEMIPFERKQNVIKEYNNIYGVPSRHTKRDCLKEYYVHKNQKNRFITLLKQDGNKVDIIAVNYDKEKDIIKITIAQQKGGSGSFNTSSEEKTLESMFDIWLNDPTKYFDILPDELNPNKNNKNYELDFVIGMMTACGEREVMHKNGLKIKYLSGKEYLLYLGLEISVSQLYYQINQDEKLSEEQKDTVAECCNFDEVYDECVKLLNYD